MERLSLNNSSKSLTTLLLESIKQGVPKASLKTLIKHASQNKVLLELLRRLNIDNELRRKQEEARTRIINEANRIANVLEGLDYAFFKLAKPVAYVPADIDILIDSDHVWCALEKLAKLGYRIVVKEPYTITLKGTVLVDLYTYLSVANMVYLDSQKLLDRIGIIEMDGVPLPTLEKPIEALVTAAHAVYKEGIFTLNDHITITGWITQKTLAVAKQLHAQYAITLAMSLAAQVEKRELEIPYKLPAPYHIYILLLKAINDSQFRVTLPKILAKLEDKRTLKLIKVRVKRKTY
jgi:hypothetical protein